MTRFGRIVAGCLAGALGFVAAADDSGVTFNEDIAPILFEHCSMCHRPGESAPFPLLTYDDARKHDKQIAQVTRSGFMPPWLPERGFRKFRGERGLTDAQIEAFRTWHESGAPEGDPADLPPMPKWTVGWPLGEPDLVIEPAEDYTLPADGIDVFRNLVLPIPTDKTRYVRTIDLRPGNPRVVHHAVMRVDRSRSSRLLDQMDAEPGYEGMEWGEAQPPEGHFLGWTPGKVPYPGSDDEAWGLEPGSDLVVQLHMVPSGKREPIRPQVGIYFASGPPKRPMDTIVLDVKKIDIPPGKRDYIVEESYRLPIDVELVSVYPHAHYLGKKLMGWADLPDGEKTWLMRIEDWDFNWQDQYRYTEPVRLPAGSTIALRYTYDNSSDNVRNPNYPPKRVVAGNRSTDEMGSMSFEIVLESDADRLKLREALLRQDLERWPNYWIAHGLLGTLLLNRGDTRGALTHLERAVTLNPEYAVGHNNLGMAQSQTGQHEPAIASFTRALRLRPNYADAHYNLGVALATTGRLEQAIGHYRQALEVRAYDPDVHNNLGVALAVQGRMEEATAYFRRALELAPDSSDAHGNLANMLMEQGWYADAIGHYRQALKIAPGSADLEANLSMALEVMTEVDSRIAVVERAIEAGRSDAHLLSELADLYAAAGRYGDAVSTTRKALDLATSSRAEGLARALRARLATFENAATERE